MTITRKTTKTKTKTITENKMPFQPHLIMPTDIVIVGVVVSLLVWDAWLLQQKGEASTISWRIVYWEKRAPIVALLLGILMGHLAWPNHAWCN